MLLVGCGLPPPSLDFQSFIYLNWVSGCKSVNREMSVHVSFAVSDGVSELELHEHVNTKSSDLEHTL